MDNSQLKEILKMDLQIMGDRRDYYLDILLSAAQSRIGGLGITLDTNDSEDCMLVVMYAANLYRQRANPTAQISLMVKKAVNDRLLKEKMRCDNGRRS